MNPPLIWDDCLLTAADVGIWASVTSRGDWYSEGAGIRLYQISMDSDAQDFALMRLGVATRCGTRTCFSMHQLPPDLPQTIYLGGVQP